VKAVTALVRGELDAALKRLRRMLADERGLSLIETVMATVIFMIAAFGLMDVLTSSTNAHAHSALSSLGEEVAQTQMENVRELPYTAAIGSPQIGVVDGNPAGSVPASQTATALGFPQLNATVDTAIKYVPDGIPGGYNQTTNYKQVTVSVVSNATSAVIAQDISYVAPPTEAEQGNSTQGVISLTVLDTGGGGGIPVANVPIELTSGPSSPLNDTTNSTGNVIFPGLTFNPTSGPQDYYDIVTTLPSGYVAASSNVSEVQLNPGQDYSATLDVYQTATFDVNLTYGGSPPTGSATLTLTPTSGSAVTCTVTNGSGSCPGLLPSTQYAVSVSAEAGTLVATTTAQTDPDGQYPTDLVSNLNITLVPAPKVAAITLAGTSPTNASSVIWNVTFNTNVTGLSASNFSLVAGGAVTGAGAITVAGSGSTYTVTASTGVGTGTLGLNQTSTTGVTDTYGNALTGTATGAVYTIDKTPATVSNVTSTLANGSYTVGTLVPVTVTFSKVVYVTGIPEIQLATAGSANEEATYVSGSGTNTLTFDYTVVAFDTSGDLNYVATTSLALNGGTIIDLAGNAATLTLPATTASNSLAGNKAIVIDTTPPVVTLTTPANNSYVGSLTPTLSGAAGNLSGDGTTVTVKIYSGTGTGGALVQTLTPTRSGATWSTTAAALTAGATYTAVASQSDAAGNVGTSSANTFTVDSTTPSVTNVTSTLANGSYTVGTVVPITITFSEPVNVTGTPQLTLNTTPTARTASYLSGTGSATLTFDYTVAATDTANPLNYAATTSLALNGGTIKSLAGTAATLTLPATTASNSLGVNDTIVIDTTPPAVTLTAPANNSYTANATPTLSGAAGNASGDSATVTVTIYSGTTTGGAVVQTLTTTRSGATWTKTPTTLAQGTYTAQATQTDAAGNLGVSTANTFTVETTPPTVSSINLAGVSPTNATTVSWTVTFSAAVTGVSASNFSLAASGLSGDGSISVSGSGSSYTVTANTGTGTGTLGLNLSSVTGITDLAGNTLAGTFTGQVYTIDKTPATVTNVTSTLANGSYTVGTLVPVTITFSKVLYVSGTPQLTLNTTPTARVASYASGSGTNTLTFDYTVAATDTANPLNYAATTSLALNGGTIKDAAGNSATLTLPTPTGAGSLGTNRDIVIDTTPPTVTNVTSTLANGSYTVGTLVPVTITFSSVVNVIGTPELQLATAGSVNEEATYASGSGTATLTFDYTVAAGDTSSDLNYLSTTSLSFNGGLISDQAGNAATLTLPATTASNSLGVNKAIVIDTTPPAVTLTTPANNGYVASLTPTLSGAAGNASGDGTTVTVKIYSGTGTGGTLVQTLTPTRSGATWSTTAAALTSGATYTAVASQSDAAGNVGTSSANTFTVDNTTPTVTNVTSSPTSAYDKAGVVVPITITFSEPVNVTGTPQLTLNTTPTARVATYASGSGTNTLTFNYTVVAGDTSSDLNYAATTSLALNGGTIKSLAATAATLTLPSTTGAGSLGTNCNIVVDTTAPTASSITATPSPKDGKPDSGDEIFYTFSEAMSPSSISSGWSGSSGLSVVASFARGASGSTALTIKIGSTQLALGSVSLGDTGSTGYFLPTNTTVTETATMTMPTSSEIEIQLTQSSSGFTAVTTVSGSAPKLVWSPSSSATDLAGNAMSTSTATESSAAENF
jgi:hypothetical protein